MADRPLFMASLAHDAPFPHTAEVAPRWYAISIFLYGMCMLVLLGACNWLSSAPGQLQAAQVLKVVASQQHNLNHRSHIRQEHLRLQGVSLTVPRARRALPKPDRKPQKPPHWLPALTPEDLVTLPPPSDFYELALNEAWEAGHAGEVPCALCVTCIRIHACVGKVQGEAWLVLELQKVLLIPRWTYRGLFLGNRARMAHWDDILLQYIRDTPGIEHQMNKHRLTTNLSHGGLGLRQLWWSYITRWVTIGQQELQNNSPSRQLTATQYKYIDAVRALGGTVGQRISQPRQHRPLSAGLYDSESSEEDQETHAGKTRPATSRLDYGWVNPPDEPTPEETHEVCQALPYQQKIHGITVHYTGEPTTTRWCTDGSKRHGGAGGGIYNGTYRAAFRVHGPQQVYRAETIACALASELASPGDDIILDNQSVVKATPIKRKGVVKDQDYRDIGYLNTSSKRLTIRWTPGHRTLEQATTYKDYQDIQGNNHSDVLANMGDNLPMDSQQPQPHDIVITGQIMPTPAKAWIMQVRRQKQTPEVHWVSWLPMKHYRRNAWTPWLWGQVRWWGVGAPWE